MHYQKVVHLIESEAVNHPLVKEKAYSSLSAATIGTL